MSYLVTGASKPIVSEDKVDINERFYAHYTTYIDGASFFRPKNAWYKFTKRDHVDSNSNPHISTPATDGVLFECFEHVSVCISGSSDFTVKKHTYTYDDNGNLTSDALSDITYVWTTGVHNVDNGLGHLPTDEFTRTFNNDYATCCILPVEGADKTEVYNFEVVDLNGSSTTLNKNIKFAHVCLGTVVLNSTEYVQKQNIFNLSQGTVINSSGRSIVILAYIVE